MKDQPLKCSVEGDELVIRVGVDVVAFAARHLEIKICDPLQFAKDVSCELASEEEDGSSMLTGLLDRACVRAFEEGSIGVSEESY